MTEKKDNSILYLNIVITLNVTKSLTIWFSFQFSFVFVVWEKLKNQKQGERWIPEQEEEFEDSLGNVVNKKTFEDLKRQGLL